MLLFLQVLTILMMLGITYVIFQAFGSPRKTLLYTKQEKEEWDALIGQKLGSWFTRTNIIGTLTSLATVYLFFIGSSKLFGAWIFLCSITIWFGSLVTNYFTKRICTDSYIQQILNSPDQVGGVIASVFWRQSKEDRDMAAVIKWVSLLNIASVIWLEFALFADISGRILGLDHMGWRILLLVICCMAVFYFTLRYGLRGFVFADLFQSPMIAVGSLLILFGSALALWKLSALNSLSAQTFRPVLSQWECILFAIHVIFLNLFLVLVTEPHWLRVWIFRAKETDLQFGSCAWTAGIWIVLMLVGFAAAIVSNGKTGEDAIVGLLSYLSEISPVFSVAFWIGGIAALFSTADSQIYSLLLVSEFDVTRGTLRTRLMETLPPLKISLIASSVFAVAYAIVRYLELPFEKIIFLVIPMSLNVLPAFSLAVAGRRQHRTYVWFSIALYSLFSFLGLAQPASQFQWTLAAALAPVCVAVVVPAIAERRS